MNDLGFLWWLVPLCLLAPWLLWPLLDFIRHLYYEEKADKSYTDFCSSCPSVVTVTGMMGKGKSTLQNGLVNLSVIRHIEECQEEISDMRKIFADVDFNPINEIIAEMVKEKDFNSEHFLIRLYKELPEMRERLKGNFDIYTDVRKNEDLMVSYFDAMFALINGNYVFSDNRFYCRITENFSYPSDMGILEIKDRFIKHDFALPPHSTILIDEVSLYYGKNDYQAVARDDKGLSMGFKLERHLSEEHLKVFMTSQNFTDVTKELRSLNLGQYDITSFDPYKSRKVSWSDGIFLLEIMKAFIEWIQGWYIRLQKEQKREEASFDSLPLSALWKKCDEKEKLLSSRDYLKFKGNVYVSFDSSGAPVREEGQKFSYFIPVHFCFGSSDRLAFSFVRKKLLMVSEAKLGRSSFNRSQEEKADDLLTPKLVKKEKEKEIRSSSYDRSLDPWMQQ